MSLKKDSIKQSKPSHNCPKCDYDYWHGPKYISILGYSLGLRYTCGSCEYVLYERALDEKS